MAKSSFKKDKEESAEDKVSRRPVSERPLIMRDGETLLELLDEITDADDLVNVVCPFYKKGKASKCNGCLREDETVEDCKSAMMEGLRKRPHFGIGEVVYNPEFDLPVVKAREIKQKIEDTISMGLICNTCHVSDNCPLYAEDYECGIDWKEGVDTSDPKNVIDHLVALQLERVTRARKMELVDGGMPDQTTSGEMDRLSSLVAQRDDMDASKFSMRIDATGKSGSEGGGLLAKLFGAGNSTEALPPAEEYKTIDFEELESKPAVKHKRKEHE